MCIAADGTAAYQGTTVPSRGHLNDAEVGYLSRIVDATNRASTGSDTAGGAAHNPASGDSDHAPAF